MFILFQFPSRFGSHRLKWEGVWRDMRTLNKNTSFSVREQSGHSLKSSIQVSTYCRTMLSLMWISRCHWYLWIKFLSILSNFQFIYHEWLGICEYFKPYIGGVMVSMLASNTIDRRFRTRSGQTKHSNINICCFTVKHTVLFYLWCFVFIQNVLARDRRKYIVKQRYQITVPFHFHVLSVYSMCSQETAEMTVFYLLKDHYSN
jgi:hypothetical protein